MAPELATPPFAPCARSRLGRFIFGGRLARVSCFAPVSPNPPPDRRLPPLLPEPRCARPLPGRFRLRRDLPVVLRPSSDAASFRSCVAFRDGVEARCGIHLAIESHRQTQSLGARIELSIEERLATAAPEQARHEAYRLRVTEDLVEIVAGGGAGLRYGLETLAQLVDAQGRIPACEIEDAPLFELRGIMLDVSRGKVPRRETLEQIVDLCVSLKLNLLMLYTEHTFRFRRHPQIGAGSSPLDAETLRTLDEYAASRFVQLVPCLQSLGHMEHILRLPAYAHLAETDMAWTIAPALPGASELLADLYDEYLPNFRSPLFNANCDEPWDLGRGRSAERSHELGPGGLYLEHIGRLQELAARHGKRLMIWGDVVHAHPERIAQIDRDLILLDWWYEADLDYDRVSRFAQAGLEFLVCPGTSSWNSLFPRVENSLINISRWAAAGRRHGARGLVVTDWGDFGHYNLQGNSWLAFAWAAQESWSGASEPERFDRAFSRQLFGDARGETARLYRELGAVHDPGFAMFNGSPLQYLFFDDLQTAYFLSACQAAALVRAITRLERVQRRIAAKRADPAKAGRDERTLDELLYAADASLFTLRKAQAALEWDAWRRAPASLGASQRRELSGRLADLAAQQQALGRRLRRLWLARSEPSNLSDTERRLLRSVRSLRHAARTLAKNRPGSPPAREPITPQGALRAVRASLAR